MDNHMVSGDTNNNNNTVDALDRADGPEVSFVEAVYRGFPVWARRHPRGHWCGYLTVFGRHPWAVAARTAEDGTITAPCEFRLSGAIDVHGGCTFARILGVGITVGFDCDHYNDGRPPWMSQRESWGGVYRDLAYVRDQLLSLAEQAEQAARDADG